MFAHSHSSLETMVTPVWSIEYLQQLLPKLTFALPKEFTRGVYGVTVMRYRTHPWQPLQAQWIWQGWEQDHWVVPHCPEYQVITAAEHLYAWLTEGKRPPPVWIAD